MLKILLLGANGQLGTDLQEVLKDASRYQVQTVRRSDLDMEQPTSVAPYLDQQDFDVLINCTSYHKTDECEDHPLKTYTINSIAVAELAKWCNKQGKLLVHISTDYVFSGENDRPYIEQDTTGAVNVYGISKVAGEQAIAAYHDRYFIFRVSSLFGQAGASGKGGNFVETMIRLAREGKPLKVVSDQYMSPTHTLDIARAIKTFLDNDVQAYGVYHCSGEGSCSWYDFASEIFRQLGIKADLAPVLSSDYVTKAKRPAYSVLSNNKINSIHQMPAWTSGLTEYLTRKQYLYT
ncbi:dTDP-4-dehydrorhamnose reductase [Gordoniibacillus kamchatkensis]|uniref:dTDP-4-dehydrorhamnose reductase n=1 Tax=Gordoniibacillus kamchatkensis TaxID=1590651 RepID=UPI000A7CAA60|nr:dTDP-4-dehydrorhamnose reductase [Paenibacillus sp. VKM B-2647]